MIPVVDLHLRLDISYSNLNSNKKLDVLPEVKDMILNSAVNEFINTILTPVKNPERLGFESTEVIYSKLQRLISDKEQTVFIGHPKKGIIGNKIGYMFDNEIKQSKIVADYLDEPFFGYTFVPSNQLDVIKLMLRYKGSSCNQVVDSTSTVTEGYSVVPLSDITSTNYLSYTTAQGTIIPMVPKNLSYISSYSDDYKFIYIKHVLGFYRSPYILGSPFRLEIGYERLDGVYAKDSFIIKENTTKYLSGSEVGSIELRKLSDDTVISTYLKQLLVFTKPVTTGNTFITKGGLFSNKTIIDISKNYYYNKNKIEEVPIALRNNLYLISNITPQYLPSSLIVTYIRKPILIDSYLDQGLELEEDVDSIVAIAARLMTAYTSNSASYQISNVEQLKT